MPEHQCRSISEKITERGGAPNGGASEMSYGKAEKPCIAYKYWPTNPGLCGICAWEKDEHNGAHVRTNLEPHQVRAVQELRDLEDKREKLQVFIGGNGPIFRKLDEKEQHRLKSQFDYMSGYAMVLRERISAFL